jgi:hypothetical protein
MKVHNKKSAAYTSDLSAAISAYTVRSAIPIENHPIGSFQSWLSRHQQRLTTRRWQPHLEEKIRQAWLCPGDWAANGTGLLLANDLITYAAARLPKRYIREFRKRLFGRPANRLASVEIMIIGHALWQPDFPIYFNPYTGNGLPLAWKEILAAENMVKQKVMIL